MFVACVWHVCGLCVACLLTRMLQTCQITVSFEPVQNGISQVNLKLSTVFQNTALDESYRLRGWGTPVFDDQGQIHSSMAFTRLGGSWDYLPGGVAPNIGAVTDSSVALKAPEMDHGQKGCIVTKVEGPNVVAFHWAADMEQSYDFLKLWIDFTLVDTLTGTTPWIEESHYIPEGHHTVAFCFEKDQYGDGGMDTGYLADINLASYDGCANGNDIECNCKGDFVSGTGTCDCGVGWAGMNCEQVVCTAGCENGVCQNIDGNAKCVCNYGWSGNVCDETDECQSVTVGVTTKIWAAENYFVVSKLAGSSEWQVALQSTIGDFADNKDYQLQSCLSPGVYKIAPSDAANDGWHGGAIQVYLGEGTEEGAMLIPPSLVEPSAKPEIFEIPSISAWACENGIQDGPESDVDCGGGCSAECGFRAKCYTNDDCAVGDCAAEKGELRTICGDVEIDVTKPTNYQMIIAGVDMAIEWIVGDTVPVDVDDPWVVDIDMVSQDKSITFEVARNVSWTAATRLGAYDWEVNKFTPSGLYTVKLSWAGRPGAFQHSSLFQVSGSDVNVAGPTGNERLVAGMEVNCMFMASGYVSQVSMFLQAVAVASDGGRRAEETTEAEKGGGVEEGMIIMGSVSALSGKMTETKVTIPKTITTGFYRVVFKASEDLHGFLKEYSPSFYVSSNPGLVISSPSNESPFTSGEQMMVKWTTKGIAIDGGSLLRLSLSAECAETIGRYELRGSDITKGELVVTLPFIKSPFWVTVSVEIDGIYNDEIKALIRPESQCALGCPHRFKGDGVCQLACDNIACGFDEGDCCDMESGKAGVGMLGENATDACVDVTIATFSAQYGEEISWEIPGSCPPVYAEFGTFSQMGWNNVSVCLPAGTDRSFRGFDSWGDGWGESYVVIVLDGEEQDVVVLDKTRVEFTSHVYHFDVCLENNCQLHGRTNCEDEVRLTESGLLCQFPFRVDGVEQFDCVAHDTIVGLEQCAVEVDPCACAMDGFSGGVDTGKMGCFAGTDKESVDLFCKSEHEFAGSDTWCYVKDPVACSLMTGDERIFKGLKEVTFYEGISMLGSGWRYCKAGGEGEDNYVGELVTCELCSPYEAVVGLTEEMIYGIVGACGFMVFFFLVFYCKYRIGQRKLAKVQVEMRRMSLAADGAQAEKDLVRKQHDSARQLNVVNDQNHAAQLASSMLELNVLREELESKNRLVDLKEQEIAGLRFGAGGPPGMAGGASPDALRRRAEEAEKKAAQLYGILQKVQQNGGGVISNEQRDEIFKGME